MDVLLGTVTAIHIPSVNCMYCLRRGLTLWVVLLLATMSPIVAKASTITGFCSYPFDCLNGAYLRRWAAKLDEEVGEEVHIRTQLNHFAKVLLNKAITFVAMEVVPYLPLFPSGA